VDLVERMLAGDVRALARLITYIESRHPELPQLMEKAYSHGGEAHIIGITGPPGAGKSTLVDKMTMHFREQGKRVGIVAIDPSSPFSGGALLGDRIRMSQHASDDGVFIRSLGTRGSHGGLSLATREVVRLLNSAGFDIIVVETVGVGQTELDIMELADSTVVVFVPESGDTVQTMKAGLTEIADIFVVNKSDREGASIMYRELQLMIEMANAKPWTPRLLSTVASKNEGVSDLVEALAEHQSFLSESDIGQKKRRAGNLVEFIEILTGEIGDRIRDESAQDGLAELIEQVKSGKTNPYLAALTVLRDPVLLRDLFAFDGKKKDSD